MPFDASLILVFRARNADGSEDMTALYAMIDAAILAQALEGLSTVQQAVVNSYRYVPTAADYALRGFPTWAGNDPAPLYFSALGTPSEQAEQFRRRALGMFLRGEAIAGTPVEAYLGGRGIRLEQLGRVPNCLAFDPELYCKEAQRKLPAMLAAIVDVRGRHIATHRTWLAPDGKGGWGKADLEEPKKVLGRFKGGYIPLWKGACRKTLAELDAGVDVYASEGIEDGLSAAMAKPELRIVAAVTLGNIGELELPDQAGRLVIIGQRDTHPRTLEAIERAIALQQERGREVWLTPPPAGGFKDVNEALQAEVA
jgi:hypothetical protein